MASTYVNNLRLEEMANGENSGTWGTKTNVNLELIGQSTAWGTRAIADASTDNITIADGSADADRCLGLKLTGGGQACTVTLLPNTSSKTWFMYNATSYTLTFTCGSGANVAIPAGQTKVIATDGLGSGGVVHDLLTGVSAAGDLNVAGDIITASTLQATGDTAAGDDAAIGYTAAEGLILTGQGSTNDVTIKNDADADVLEIPTGTTNVTIVGNCSAGTLTVGSGSITDSSGAIDFGNENLVTTGTLGGGAGTVTSLDAGSGVIKTTGTIELGHATDTTLSRSAAGFLAVEGNDVLMASVDDVLTAGFSSTADDDGTKSSGTYTPATAGGNYKQIVGGGAFTLAPQTTVSSIVIQLTNNASAGTLTTSGYTIVTGDSLTTTNGDDFMMYSTVVGSFKHLNVVALQ